MHRGSFDLNFRQLEATELASLAGVDSDSVDGLVSARVVGSIETSVNQLRVQGRSQARLEQGQWQGIEFEVDSADSQWSYDSARGQFQLHASGAQASVFGGSLATDLDLVLGPRPRVELVAEVDQLPTGQIVSWVSGEQSADRGTFAGQLKLTSNYLQSVDDLEGSLQGRIEQSQALQLPVLNNLARYVNRSQLGSHRFEAGKVDVSLQKSRLVVHQLSFADQQAQIMASGTAKLEGRLDLQLIVHLGRANRDQLWNLLQSPLLARSNPPLALLADIERLLSDRMLFSKSEVIYAAQG